MNASARSLVFALLSVLVAAPGCSLRSLKQERPLAEEKLIRTPDGTQIRMVHYAPVGGRRGRPVLLVHGIGANSRNLDVDDAHSLTYWFAQQGREVWALSTRVGVKQDDGETGIANFDQLWQQDITTAIRHAREHSNPPVPEIDYVGHSLGGVLLYAYLSQGGEGVARGVTLASPTRFNFGSTVLEYLAAQGRGIFDEDGRIPLLAVVAVLAPLQGRFDDLALESFYFNPKNVTSAAWRELLRVGLADIPTRLWLQMAKWVQTGDFQSADGRIDYRKDMARIRTPILAVAGRLDRVAPPPSVRDGYDALGGPKSWLMLGLETGAEHDYGHMDFTIGENAPREVWAKVLAFLEAPAP